MANDCLLTQLKGAVNTDLQYLNGIRYKKTATSSGYTINNWQQDGIGDNCVCPKDCDFVPISNILKVTCQVGQTSTDYTSRFTMMRSTATVYPVDAGKPIYFAVIGLDKIYSAGQMGSDIQVIDIEELKYMPNLAYLTLRNAKQKVEITELLDGALFVPENIVKFNAREWVAGDIESFGVFKNFKYLNLFGDTRAYVHGSIEDLAASLQSHGADGSVVREILVKSPNITYQGNPCTNMDGSYYLTWDSSAVPTLTPKS